MHTRPGTLAFTAIAALALAGCTSGGEATPTPTTPAPTDTVAMQDCLPVPGDALTVLADDLMLQNSDNIIPAIGADVADDAVLEALNAVSAQLDTDGLIALNRAVDIDRRTSAEVAAEWVDAAGITLTSTGSGSLVVGAANFSENITLGEIYAEVLRDAGYSVETRSIGNRETYLPALVSGEINIVPEYAATFAEFLNLRANGADAAPVASGDIAETVAALAPLAEAEGLVIGEAAAAQDQNAFAVTEAFAAQYGVSTLSELAETCGPIVLGGPPECPERPFCQLGLEDTYGIEVSEFRSLDVGGPLTKTAIQQGEIAVGLVFSSDGALG
ncbi:MAG: glycine/betaine ABC transporter substrate-binding protein [Actinobacteria bacterium HGW-Actinobacteria-4]|nr:MAG: glycine/betaine ABC transporter substrate-binding protein [Actinobacteria bacterium HGW-Actinobacteria-4]